jgi:hypothetical protein
MRLAMNDPFKLQLAQISDVEKMIGFLQMNEFTKESIINSDILKNKKYSVQKIHNRFVKLDEYMKDLQLIRYFLK